MKKHRIILLIVLLLIIAINEIQKNSIHHYPKKINIIDLKKENKDFYGWLKIENTNINYPVMYSKNDYYLNHDFYHNNYEYGTPYIDKSNKIEPLDTNLIIHGHNTSNDKMFGSLKKYKDYNYYLKHKIIDFNTSFEEAKYEIISIFTSEIYNKNENNFKYYKFYKSNSYEEYNDFIKNIKKQSLHDIKTKIKNNNKLITLSTCDNSIKNGRLVLVAQKIT